MEKTIFWEKLQIPNIDHFDFVSDGPSVVKLMMKSKELSAGKTHEIKCEAIGAKPQATITWWVGGTEVSWYYSNSFVVQLFT